MKNQFVMKNQFAVSVTLTVLELLYYCEDQGQFRFRQSFINLDVFLVTLASARAAI